MKNDESVPFMRLRVAVLLALAGGFLDAYTYFEKGGVFANAQTGNIILAGISLTHEGGAHFPEYAVPILAFSCGILCSMVIEGYLKRRGIRFVRRSVLILEMLIIFAVGMIPSATRFNMIANVLVSFVAAIQMETFKAFRGEPIATTMSTGNLRKFVENFYRALVFLDPAAMRKARSYFVVLLTFTAGACLGAFFCELYARWAVFFPILCLFAALCTITVIKWQD